MLADILSHCMDDTLLCIACNVTLSEEFIVTKPISQWRQESQPDLYKKPTVFLLLA
jgi:16S rRNA (cytidine1402-2'-O)-methyltransferase